jgi:uncharacterized protein (TIGR02145 family)
MAEYFLFHLIGLNIEFITNLKKRKMNCKFLLLIILPILGLAQTNSKVEMPMGENTTSEKQALEIKRNVQYNLEEIKVRWKKAALENCPGVPCVTAPSFTCGTSTMWDKDNNSYSTVSIGAQCWTTTNLKVTKYDDGSLIPDLTSSTSNPWAPTSGARTGYDVSVVPLSDYVGTFGYLYNWHAVNDLRKLCPAGWHVPTDAEWTTMIQTLDPSQVVNSGNVSTFNGAQSTTAGFVMKSTVTNSSNGSGLGWNPANPASEGNNTSGFSALPGGVRPLSGNFAIIRDNAIFWSATEFVTSTAWNRELYYNAGVVIRTTSAKSDGASVRCLRD